MTKTRSPRSIARSDILAIACLGFMVGVNFAMGLMYFLRSENVQALSYALLVPCLVGAIAVVARRTLRKIPDERARRPFVLVA